MFEGDITDYWSPAVVRHWVLHLSGMKPTDFKLYTLLRAMLTSSPRGLRRMSVDELCWLLTEEGEKPVGESTVRAALKRLEKANLVTNPDGERIVTSTGKGGIQTISRRYKVHDLPPDVHVGWANTWQKLDAYRPDWRENPIVPPTHTKSPDGIVRSKSSGRTDLGEQSPTEGPEDETAGRFDRSISSSAQQKSSSRAQKSSSHTAVTSGNEGGIQSLVRSSLSPSAEDAAATSVTPDAGMTKTRETAAPEDNPTSAAAGVPAPREGQADDGQRSELLEMLLGLPGRDRMNRDEVAEMLLPLAVEALAVGWTAPKLRTHLARSCDPQRVYDPAAIYRKHLKKLPPVPAGASGHPAATAPQCSKCNGSGLAEDPATFLPIGPCECRKAPVLVAAS
ncbi:hypothetical protein NFX46_39960 (plasmid) [Streptomyces phaeoluteigriseus]|uniref:Helix-turn-helix domain-containing protein n=1 Tax=Streptomyces phaeoluteigriseus TaxID=114686 RepID=A0ABY4ZMD6_9ACTN|nr:hypothetical protein [Streptomyces phaeoluteigriseus]USQ89865.1 hypothetical protein NFX46_39960 [Streptomyces phaeoluteigriseus]